MRAKGLEPIRLTAPDPKSGLATNYNTPARLSSEKVGKDRDLIREGKIFSRHFTTATHWPPFPCLRLQRLPETGAAPVVHGVAFREYKTAGFGDAAYHREVFRVEAADEQQSAFAE